MRRALDTNVLIYAHMPSLKEHEPVRRFLLDQLANSQVKLVLTPGVLHEFVHVITDHRRFEPPVKMSEALAVARLYLSRTNVELISPDEQALSKTFDLLEAHQLGRKRIADTLLAATLLQNKVKEIITCNPGDFSAFNELNVIDPLR